MFKFILSATLLLQLLLQTECCKSNFVQQYFRTAAYGTKVFAGESCIADEEYGSCIPLLECGPLIEEIRRQGNPMPTFLRNKLQRLTCGFEYTAPMKFLISVTKTSEMANFSNVNRARDLVINSCAYKLPLRQGGSENSPILPSTATYFKRIFSYFLGPVVDFDGGEAGATRKSVQGFRFVIQPNPGKCTVRYSDRNEAEVPTALDRLPCMILPRKYPLVVCCVPPSIVPEEPNWGTFHVATQPTPRPTNSDSLNFVNSGENYNNNNNYNDNNYSNNNNNNNNNYNNNNSNSNSNSNNNSNSNSNNNSNSNKNNDSDNTEPFTRKPIENRRGGPPDIEGNPKLSLLPQKCGSIESDRIWGGNRTRLFEMPWMALLSYDSGRGLKLACGGTIINEWYVLTAAHCVSFLGNNMRLDGVILGEHDVRTDPDCEMSDGVQYCAPRVTNSSIASVIAHPGYSPQTLQDDIALIRLAEPANFKLESVKPICLPIDRTLQTENLAGKIGVVAGWGVTEEGLQSPVLLSVDLPIVSYKDCYAAYNGTLQITKKQICAGGVKDKDSCGGDSGGPLMYPGKYGKHGLRYIQRGLVSFGSKRCGLPGYPGVYTNIAYYMDWILDNMHA